jgi:hypothetical protein
MKKWGSRDIAVGIETGYMLRAENIFQAAA